MSVCEQVVRAMRGVCGEAARRVGTLHARACVAAANASARVRRAAGLARDEAGQGTTEYAILVGVLVVIAIIAIVAFRGKVQELWDAIASGINGL